MAKNRNVIITHESEIEVEIRLDQLAESLSPEDFTEVQLNLSKPQTVWVATFRAKISKLEGIRNFAIVMNASSVTQATDIQPLNTFVEALEAFRTAMSFRFFEWLNQNKEVFAAYKASLGYVWA